MTVRRHRPPVEVLPAHLVSLDPKPRYEDTRASLTTLCVTVRCEGCPWLDVCGRDQTCWELERGREWSRSRADLRRGGR